MSLIVVGVIVAIVVLVLLNRRRWRALGRGARAFGHRLSEGYQKPGRLPAREAASAEQGFGPLGGFLAVATDGTAGQVERLSADSRELIVSIDPLVEGRLIAVPASAILEVDHEHARVLLDRSKEELAGAARIDHQTTRFRAPSQG